MTIFFYKEIMSHFAIARNLNPGKEKNMKNMIIFNTIRWKIEKQLKSTGDELKLMPEGTLHRIKKQDGTWAYKICNQKEGKYCRKAINKEPHIIAMLCRKEYLLIQRNMLLHNLKLMEKLINSYMEITEEHIIESLPKQYKGVDKDYFLETYSRIKEDKIEKEKWESRPYEKSGYRVNEKKHCTSRGLKVRSKSEILIAEKLYEYGIEFHYEEILHIGEKTFVPDFTIRRSDGTLSYWEHCGMTANQEYMRHHRKKLNEYESIGIVPWKNLIVTYDDEDGNIDIAIIESEIKNKLL